MELHVSLNSFRGCESQDKCNRGRRGDQSGASRPNGFPQEKKIEARTIVVPAPPVKAEEEGNDECGRMNDVWGE
jgi:hypothetical protein